MTLATDRVLDHNLLDHILLSGFSRIPVHQPGQKDNFVGMLLVKKVRPLFPCRSHNASVADIGVFLRVCDDTVDQLQSRAMPKSRRVPTLVPSGS